MGWIKRLIGSRNVKSALRYGLVMLVATMIKIPVLADLAEFLSSNSEQLTNILAAIIMAFAGTWSVSKNAANAKIEKETRSKVK